MRTVTCTLRSTRLLNKRKMAAATARCGASPRVDTSDTEGFGPVTVLLPCYLPNEQGILRETVAHILEKIEYPATLELILCYNTPTPMLEVEEELAAMANPRPNPSPDPNPNPTPNPTPNPNPNQAASGDMRLLRKCIDLNTLGQESSRLSVHVRP